MPGGTPSVDITIIGGSGGSLELVSYSPETLSRTGASVKAGGTSVNWNAGPANPKPDNCTSGDRGGQGAPTGLFGGGQTFTAVFEVKKPFTAWARVRVSTANEQGGAYAQMPVLVADKNLAPVPALTWKQQDGLLTADFDGSKSYDTDGKITQYQWDFGDGTTATGEKVTHQYKEPKAYDAKLTVVDNLDGRDSTVQKVTLTSTIRISKAEMTGASTFTVVVDAKFAAASGREMDVSVNMRSGSNFISPWVVLQRKLRDKDIPSGANQVEVVFDLKAEGVKRFVERIETETTVDVREVQSNGNVTRTERDKKEGTIPLPVVITHGIMGDLAHLAYGSIGPGMQSLATSLSNEKYSEAGRYPTIKQVVYPSLHIGGLEFLARNYMKPAVEESLSRTYADKVDIVAHSMGGLVSRVYIEFLDGGPKVRKLVMLGTPLEGAAKAHLAVATADSAAALQAPGAVLLGFAAQWVPGLGKYLQEQFAVQSPADTGVTTSMQLLPDYAYYTEIGFGGSPVRGPGFPTDAGMNLQRGDYGLLGRNELLHSLNTKGFASGVEYFQIYRANHDTPTEIVVTNTGTKWDSKVLMGPGDATVPLRSLVMADYPALSAQLQKCIIPGTEHYLMMGDSSTGVQVRTILLLEKGSAVRGCNR